MFDVKLKVSLDHVKITCLSLVKEKCKQNLMSHDRQSSNEAAT